MDRDKFLEMVQKLPSGTKILVRGGSAASDDAWTPTIRVYSSSERLTAVVEMASIREHYNYPEDYSSVIEVTDQYFK